MRVLSLAVPALTLTLGLATTHKCRNITVPVAIAARNGVFNVSPTQSNIEVTDFVLNGVRQGRNTSDEVLEGYADISGTYNLATTYCEPDHRRSQTVQLLTHGISFDRSYWNLPYNNYNYSYVSVAVDQYGYSTLSWDRLGIGMSDHPDPISAVQSPLERAALIALTKALQAGRISDVPQYSKVVHVGHSFGAELSYGLSRDMPELTCGIVLTGFTHNVTFLPYFLLGGNFIAVQNSPLAAQYAPGYWVAGDASRMQANFFAPGTFDPDILQYANTNGQPVSTGELLTIGSEAMGTSNAAVPVLIITGERDLPYCGGDCHATGSTLPNILSSSQQYFPKATKFEAFIVPGAGHALNMDYSHTLTYETIQQFLRGNGLEGRRGGPPRRI